MIFRMMLCALLCTTSLAPKTALTSAGKDRAAGYISGRVEVILQTMSLSAEQRRAMLEVEYRNMMTLGLDKTESALFKKIEAHLGLAKVQKERLRTLAENEKEHKGSQDEFVAYAKEVIAQAATYSDAIDVPGLPSVSQQRQLSMVERAHAAATSEELSDAYQNAIKVHKKVRQALEKSSTIKALVQSFTTHMKRKYKARDKGLDGEILFRVFDIFATATPEDARTISDIVGPFLDKFNSYVPDKYQFDEGQLSISYIGWPEVILESRRAEAHIMLVLSFAMEQVKKSSKDDLVFVEQKEMLAEKTAEAVAVLERVQVKIPADKKEQPLHVALQCSAYVESIINKAGGRDKLLPQQRAQAQEMLSVAQQINQLITDYETVARRQADSQAVQRMQEERASLSSEHQSVLTHGAVDNDPLARMLHAKDAGLVQPARKSSTIAKWVPVVLAIGIGIMWQVFGTMAKKKKEEAEKNNDNLNGFWGFFERVGTPRDAASNGLNKMKKRFLKSASNDSAASTESRTEGGQEQESPADDPARPADKPGATQGDDGKDGKPTPPPAADGSTDGQGAGDIPPPPVPE